MQALGLPRHRRRCLRLSRRDPDTARKSGPTVFGSSAMHCRMVERWRFGCRRPKAARFCSTVKPAVAIAANIAGMPPAITRNLPGFGDQKRIAHRR